MSDLNEKMKAALGELTFQNIVKLQQMEEMAARIAELEKNQKEPEKAAD